MYYAVRRHRPAFRAVAGFVAFLFIYLGFIAAFHHAEDTGAFRPVTQAVLCGMPDAQPFPLLNAEPKDCKVCAFLANLVSPAFTLALSAPATTPKTPALPASTDIYVGDIPSVHAPRAPPAA